MLDTYFDDFEAFLRTGGSERIAGFVASGSNLAALDVYRNGHLKTCTGALASSYPVVRSLVGDDCFRGMARAYVESHPPQRATLVGYGERFSDFLRARIQQHGLAYLPDTAAMDAAWLASYFAGDGEPLTVADVNSMAAQGVEFADVPVGLSPSTQLVELTHDIVETWALIREHGTLTERARVRRDDNTALMWRLDARIHVRALARGESAFLSAIADTSTLRAAANRALSVDQAFDLATTFAALLDNRLLQTGHH